MAIIGSITKETSKFRVNGRDYTAQYEARTTLWELLFEQLGLTGTVLSCDRGTCGVCTVEVGGLPVYSCHILASDCAGKEITTIEGISNGKDGSLAPIQRLAHRYHAVQCGYCTPGWMVAAKSIHAKNKGVVTEEKVREGLAGHLCRCGCYPEIVRCVTDSAKPDSSGVDHLVSAGASEEEHCIIVPEPMIREWSTGGGHTFEEFLVEGDRKIRTRKWQGYPPSGNGGLNLVGKSIPPLPQVSFPKLTGTSEYATRVVLPGMLHVAILGSPYPHARIKTLETSRAALMPGVKTIITHKNAPATNPMKEELMYQGEVVALVVAETKNQAQDAVEAIGVDYEILPSAANLEQAMNFDAPDLRRPETPRGKVAANLLQLPPDNSAYCPTATARWTHGDLEEGFKLADVVKEFVYHFRGAAVIPMQPVSGVARWDADSSGGSLTFWGMSQGASPARALLARWMGINPNNVRFINRWNGGTFGTRSSLRPLDGLVAYASRLTGRPVKYVLSLSEGLPQLNVKPETIVKLKVGAKKGGQITAFKFDVSQITGAMDSVPTGGGPIDATAKDQFILYGPHIPNWEFICYCYKSNTPVVGSSRSNSQQEFKWAIECVMDEMAEAVGMDPVEFRLKHVARPGEKLNPAKDWGTDFADKPELENGALTFDSYASVETINEAAKVFGWENKPKHCDSDRFVRGFGMAVSDHHAGHLGYREAETGFAEARSEHPGEQFGAEIELGSDGRITIKSALPESGTDHDTAMAQTLGEMLGFTNLDWVRILWGDSDAPVSGTTGGARSNTLQGGSVLTAGDKLRTEVLRRAAKVLKVDAAKLKLKDGAVFSTEEPSRTVSFSELVKKTGDGGPIRMLGVCKTRVGKGRALVRSVGACFVEVEVDTLTGIWRVVRVVESHDAGKVINPLLSKTDMDGSFIQGTSTVSEMLPWDSEYPGHSLYSNGFLSYRIPTIMEYPEKITHIFVESLEPRWFFGYKSSSETTIGAVPSAITNAIYNALGVRIREHPITPEHILASMRG